MYQPRPQWPGVEAAGDINSKPYVSALSVAKIVSGIPAKHLYEGVKSKVAEKSLSFRRNCASIRVFKPNKIWAALQSNNLRNEVVNDALKSVSDWRTATSPQAAAENI